MAESTNIKCENKTTWNEFRNKPSRGKQADGVQINFEK